MKDSNLERRIERLESHTVRQDAVYAMDLGSEIAICSTDARVAPADFKQLYPTGVIVGKLRPEEWNAL